MSKYYDPAFPRDNPAPDGWSQHGMTLRDYFAAKAVQSLIVTFASVPIGGEDAWDEMVTKRAYKIADAMLSERDK